MRVSHRITTIQLDVASYKNDRNGIAQKIVRSRGNENEKDVKKARLRRWLDETFEEGAWNGLGDARAHIDS